MKKKDEKNTLLDQYVKYTVFVDDMDGDIYYGIEELLFAVKYAFDNGAKKVVIKK